MNTQAAPTDVLSKGPPISAVLPSADSATAPPNAPLPVSSLAVSLAPCWLHVLPERTNAHAAPAELLSPPPPISAVLPSSDSATVPPKEPAPASSLGVSAPPCWLHVPPERT